MNEKIASPKLSVIIPVYNVNKYVLLAIDSVINQTVKPFEIIIVNDGSTDNSGDLVEKHYGHLSNVNIIHTINQGLGEARNVGTRAANGDFIYYFDSDDLLELNLIAEFNKQFYKDPDIEIYAFSAESFVDDIVQSDLELQVKLPRYRREIEDTFECGEDAFNALSLKELFFPNAWLYIYKRRIQTQNDLFFKPIIHEDEEFTPRLFFSAGKTVVTDSVFFRRRVRAGSIMQTRRSEKNIIGYIRSIEAVEVISATSHNMISRKNLEQRIINNLINIIQVEKELGETLCAETRKESSKVKNKYHNVLTRMAEINFFSYRVLRFLLRKTRVLTIK
ncbi:capsular biosynthesis protein [[Pantoea] beijingensis]|uniref:Capsular biosynthesis protein n=1 Tax=[Pantoea] beijingensis TaxID=1324864 RepID=A0A443IAM9_9GAMM|nr:glycosyltransferase [[Pantoea] beijingensis]RWR01192.1 capsular biosynthesis protein [[Pantoea] beijingensis]